MTDYSKLKAELSDISSILAKFPDELKPKVFDILVQSFTGNSNFISSQQPSREGQVQEPVQSDSAKSTKKKEVSTPNATAKKTSGAKKSSNESYSIDRNLNLRGGNDIPSFKDFYDEKKPTTVSEINAVAVYYLKELMKMDTVTFNHVYTCYKEISKKPADHFKQSFIDTKNKKGYIEYDDNWNLSIPHRGVSFVEHDMPKVGKKKAK